MKIAHQGRRQTFPLGTPNKAAAATSARDIYLHLLAHGWGFVGKGGQASSGIAASDFQDSGQTKANGVGVGQCIPKASSQILL
jgi:hypothetical protein